MPKKFLARGLWTNDSLDGVSQGSRSPDLILKVLEPEANQGDQKCMDEAQVSGAKKLFAYIDHPTKWRFVYLHWGSEICKPPSPFYWWVGLARDVWPEKNALWAVFCVWLGLWIHSLPRSAFGVCVFAVCQWPQKTRNQKWTWTGTHGLKGQWSGMARRSSILGAVAQLKWKYSQIGCAPSSDEALPLQPFITRNPSSFLLVPLFRFFSVCLSHANRQAASKISSDGWITYRVL